MEILETKTDIGLIRDKNEDATLSIKHPRNKNIKLLKLSDFCKKHSRMSFVSRTKEKNNV